MPTADKIPLKRFLHTVCLPALTAHAPYFSLGELRRCLVAHKVQAATATLPRYLHEAVAEGSLHDAGRGWYSTLITPFTLNHKPVEELVAVIKRCFPLLEFSCWSSEQVASYGHLLLTRFVSFVHTERDAMESVADGLRDEGWDPWLHPTRQEAAKNFRVTDKTVIVRPTVQRAPVEGHFAAIEKILVDFVPEMRALPLLDAGEFRRLVGNLAGSQRISVGTLARYATRRDVRLDDVLGAVINESRN
ncbi:MAG: DUF6577 family protein [Prosthecobacter sp.]|uniref:DUF6577 family protein n=1 Tax=Prosthecobacter sp. TaxID=1965333 RepID=UPI003900ACEF